MWSLFSLFHQYVMKLYVIKEYSNKKNTATGITVVKHSNQHCGMMNSRHLYFCSCLSCDAIVFSHSQSFTMYVHVFTVLSSEDNV